MNKNYEKNIIRHKSGFRNGKAKKLEKIISSKIDKTKFETDIKYTEYAGHATEISKNAVGKYDAVIIAGGDGSVNEAAQSLINTGTALGKTGFLISEFVNLHPGKFLKLSFSVYQHSNNNPV